MLFIQRYSEENNFVLLKKWVNIFLIITISLDITYTTCWAIYSVEFPQKIEFKTLQSIDRLTEYNVTIIYNKNISYVSFILFCNCLIVLSILDIYVIYYYNLLKLKKERIYLRKANCLKSGSFFIILISSIISLSYLKDLDLNCPEGFQNMKDKLCCLQSTLLSDCDPANAIKETNNSGPHDLVLFTFISYYFFTTLVFTLPAK